MLGGQGGGVVAPTINTPSILVHYQPHEVRCIHGLECPGLHSWVPAGLPTWVPARLPARLPTRDTAAAPINVTVSSGDSVACSKLGSSL